MKKRVLSLFLLFALLCTVLASCNDGTSGEIPDADRVDGSWEGVDFGGQKVNVCVSKNKWIQSYFPAGDIYTKGPDKASANEVTKEVLARNKRAADELEIEIVYSERDLVNTKIQEDIRSIVQTAAKNSPDVYNNDLYGIARAMVDGLLWNVKNPGADIKSYFDFEADGWYYDYMQGCTFDQEKLYIFAGDYFIDMVRMAWSIFVNHDLFAASLGRMPSWCKSIDDFYAYVEDGFWDLDMLATLSSAAFADSGFLGEVEKTDERIGLHLSRLHGRLLSAASRITTYYQDEDLNPRVLDSIDEYQKVANKYTELLETQGVLYEEHAATDYVVDPLLWGNVMFCFSCIGEMESAELRNFSAERGLVPLPKWNANEQDEYFTPVHDQAELGCILKTAKAFTAASALMQYLNEDSRQVVYAYYDKGLKYKYNEDKHAREMMDIVRDTVDSPFSWQIGVICENFYTGQPALEGLWLIKNTVVSSTFASEKDVYNECMRQMIEKFKTLE